MLRPAAVRDVAPYQGNRPRRPQRPARNLGTRPDRRHHRCVPLTPLLLPPARHRRPGPADEATPSARLCTRADHHDDRGLANGTAQPRIVETAGSCSSLVTKYLLETMPGASTAYPPRDDATWDDADEVVSEGAVTGASALELAREAEVEGEADAAVRGPLPKELIELLLRTSEFPSISFDRAMSVSIADRAHSIVHSRHRQRRPEERLVPPGRQTRRLAPVPLQLLAPPQDERGHEYP